MWAQQPTVSLPAPSPATCQPWAVHLLWGFCYLQVAYPLPVLDHHSTPGSLRCKAELCPVTVGEPQDDERPPPVHGKLSAPCVALTSGATGPVELKLPRLLSPGVPAASLPLAVAPTKPLNSQDPSPGPSIGVRCPHPSARPLAALVPEGLAAASAAAGPCCTWCGPRQPTPAKEPALDPRPPHVPPCWRGHGYLSAFFPRGQRFSTWDPPRPAATALGTTDTDWAPLLAAESETLRSALQPVSQQAVSVFCCHWDRLRHAW